MEHWGLILAEMRWTVDRFDSIDSTNRYLLDLPPAQAVPGRVVVASFQSAGRGRLDRHWESKPGDSLMFSVLWPVELIEVATRSMALAVSDVCDFATGLKWPNDVLVDDRKLAGILAETSSSGGEIEKVVVGCGLNVRRAPIEGATFYDEWASETADIDRLFDEILNALGLWIDSPDTVSEAFRRRCVTIGRDVKVMLRDEIVEGRALDVGVDGSLIVDTGDRQRLFTIGDVIHVR